MQKLNSLLGDKYDGHSTSGLIGRYFRLMCISHIYRSLDLLFSNNRLDAEVGICHCQK